jgi:hypothetical protein
MDDGSEIRMYLEKKQITAWTDNKPYFDYIKCKLYMKWKDDKFVDWYDIQKGRDLFGDSLLEDMPSEHFRNRSQDFFFSHQPKKILAKRPFMDEYIECDNKENYYKGEIYLIPVKIERPKVIRHYVYFPNRAEDYYTMRTGLQGTDEKEIEMKETNLQWFEEQVKSVKYETGSWREKEEIETKEYIYSRQAQDCKPEANKYLKQQLEKIRLDKKWVRNNTIVIEEIQKWLEYWDDDYEPPKPATYTERFRSLFRRKALLTQLQDLSL